LAQGVHGVGGRRIAAERHRAAASDLVEQQRSALRDHEHLAGRQRIDAVHEPRVGCQGVEHHRILLVGHGFLVEQRLDLGQRLQWLEAVGRDLVRRGDHLVDEHHLAAGEHLRMAGDERLGVLLGRRGGLGGQLAFIELSQQGLFAALDLDRIVRILVQLVLAGGVRQQLAQDDALQRLLLGGLHDLRVAGAEPAQFTPQLQRGDLLAIDRGHHLPGGLAAPGELLDLVAAGERHARGQDGDHRQASRFQTNLPRAGTRS
jgi:hypothetical protein